MSANCDKRERVGETGGDREKGAGQSYKVLGLSSPKSGASGYTYAILTPHINQTLQNKTNLSLLRNK